MAVTRPDLPKLERRSLSATGTDGTLDLTGALIEPDGSPPVRARRIRIRESELRGVEFEAGSAPGLMVVDAILRDCNASNIDAREGSIRRAEIDRSRLVGFGLTKGEVQDLKIADSTLAMASFTAARLRGVSFERVNLSEVSFMDARLEAVEFVDCDLSGTDFRRARFKACAIRGSSLEDVLGVESLKGVRVPWQDLIASTGALAAALGIEVDPVDRGTGP